MAGTATTSALSLFGEQAVEMELYAVAALRRTQTPAERDLTNSLLRHARGIQSLTEKWQHLTH